jgi:prepilin-type processing-associated H-X9-DG protein
MGMALNFLLCPSDGNVPSGPLTFSDGTQHQGGYHSYPNNIGTFYNVNSANKIDGPAYLLGYSIGGSVVTFASITDGLSNTVIFSECIRGKNEKVSYGKHQVYPGTLSYKAVTSLTMLAASCNPLPTATPSWGNKGELWLDDNCGAGGCYSHVMTPNKMSCFWSDAQISSFMGLITASSNHAGGVNVGALDGSVKFVKDSISQRTWWSLATHQGGEIIDASSY